ncbi:hypothetical protein DL89DRAFT_119667 [Linderina pennispora]|uniref:F-box domain-containing protein n=1 Tax=Linderina pennispora TaxID=61395 RepID=A0A1Y1WC19_9FUNG|nr:uncharacterized protein DL89DRAFT_119667 [Linderina pennispora]ORX71089.1 hypothetical protein DL89DRAFT_119667 [Linderina pennispora]
MYSVVIENIFFFYSDPYKNSVYWRLPADNGLFKAFQPLGAVCRVWRVVALPYMYQFATCELRYALDIGGINRAVWSDNLLLIKSAGAQHMLSGLSIHVDVANPWVVVEYLKQLDIDFITWYQFTTLRFIVGNQGVLRPQELCPPEALELMCSFLVDTIPGLREIYTIPSEGIDTSGSFLLRLMIRRFAWRLERLNILSLTPVKLSLDSDTRLANIKHLNIQSYSELPHSFYTNVQIYSLETLSLKPCDLDLFVTQLVCKHTVGNFRFPKLRRLTIHGPENPTNAFIFHHQRFKTPLLISHSPFPALEFLSLSCYSPNTSRFLRLVHTSPLHTLHLIMIGASCLDIELSKLKDLQEIRVVVEVVGRSPMKERFREMITQAICRLPHLVRLDARFMGNARFCKPVRLDTQFSQWPHSPTLQRLRLRLRTYVSPTALVRILKQLPRLWELCVYMDVADMSEWSARYMGTDINAATPEPISYSAQTLCIDMLTHRPGSLHIMTSFVRIFRSLPNLRTRLFTAHVLPGIFQREMDFGRCSAENHAHW